uniref:Gastrula zinc finger protein XlCGF57.1-like n=1 Tax=Acanthochromis polyacanthus TaxID=80966 RepID=A0A3Q1G6Y4_9TELE
FNLTNVNMKAKNFLNQGIWRDTQKSTQESDHFSVMFVVKHLSTQERSPLVVVFVVKELTQERNHLAVMFADKDINETRTLSHTQECIRERNHLDVVFVKPFGCDVCGKRLKYQHNLKTHMAVHTGEKPFGCDVCGQRFSRNTYLETHMSVHTGEKPHTFESIQEKNHIVHFESSLQICLTVLWKHGC